MARIITPEADALLDQPIKVLDKGFVVLRDYMGGDSRVTEAARVSYAKGTKSIREDKGLISYLMRNAHTSPFEQVSLVYHMKLPLFVFAQMVRHRTAKLNSMSARYSVMEDEFYIPNPEEVRGQGTLNKQVGDGELAATDRVESTQAFAGSARESYQVYEQLLATGVSREQARMVLGQNLYTQIYWKCDLHNLMHFLRLRLDWHAQAEIRAYAEAMALGARAVAPICYEAFEEHVVHAKKFSHEEMNILKEWLKDLNNEDRAKAETLPKGIRAEFFKKFD